VSWSEIPIAPGFVARGPLTPTNTSTWLAPTFSAVISTGAVLSTSVSVTVVPRSKATPPKTPTKLPIVSAIVPDAWKIVPGESSTTSVVSPVLTCRPLERFAAFPRPPLPWLIWRSRFVSEAVNASIPTNDTLPVARSARNLVASAARASPGFGVISARPKLAFEIARPIAPARSGTSAASILPSRFASQYGPPTPKNAFTPAAPTLSIETWPVTGDAPSVVSVVTSASSIFSNPNEPVTYANWPIESVTAP
jgi:hypothetical protein